MMMNALKVNGVIIHKIIIQCIVATALFQIHRF